MYTELTTNQEVTHEITANDAAILYFYNDHCAPCISLRPKVKELVDNQFPKIKLFFVNSEKYPDIPAGFQVFSNPTLLLFFDGREYRRESKYISIPQLAEEISRPYEMLFG